VKKIDIEALRSKWKKIPLGEKPDSEISDLTGISTRSVCGVRLKLGIGAFNGLILLREGRPCRSLLEAQLDVYLHWRNIPHEHEVKVECLPYIADIKIGSVYFEVFGMRGFERYDIKTERKIRDYRTNRIKFGQISLRRIRERYLRSGLKVQFKVIRNCSTCGKEDHVLLRGYCRRCYMKYWHKIPTYTIKCPICGETKSSNRRDKFCSYRCYWLSMNKIHWPDNKALINMLNAESMRSVSKKLGIHLASLQNHIKRAGLVSIRKVGKHLLFDTVVIHKIVA
jgi:endogenous inhibitor of DNA gyrase (YacG/DUF329 family)